MGLLDCVSAKVALALHVLEQVGARGFYSTPGYPGKGREAFRANRIEIRGADVDGACAETAVGDHKLLWQSV